MRSARRDIRVLIVLACNGMDSNPVGFGFCKVHDDLIRSQILGDFAGYMFQDEPTPALRLGANRCKPTQRLPKV